MKLLHIILSFIFLSNIAFAQSDDGGTPAPINVVDNKGNKQGTWLMKYEAIRGEPGYTSIGNYTDNKKTGTWYQIDFEGKPISILKYKKGVLDGESKYFENGVLVCIGNWRGLNPDSKFDTIWVYNPETNIENEVVVSTDQGAVRHGLWKYYNPESGLLIKEEYYQVGEIIKYKEYPNHPTLKEEEKKILDKKVQKQIEAKPYKPTKVNPNKTK